MKTAVLLIGGLALALFLTTRALANHPPGPPVQVTICHKFGTPAQKTLTLPHPAAEHHIAAHGDTLGICGACAGVFDKCIDADGTASCGDGLPAAAEVLVGTPLTPFPQPVFNGSGLDMFDNDGNAAWTFGPAGDDLHAEDFTFCPTAIRNAVHDLGADCCVLDLDGSFFTGQPVSCDLEVGAFCVPPLPSPIMFNDVNANGAWDDGEDIVLDINGNGIFD